MEFLLYGKGGDETDKYKKENKSSNKGKDLTREWTYEEAWQEVLYSGNVLPKTLTEAHRVVVVDADTLVYRVAAVCDTRSVVATVRGYEVEFSNKTKLKAYCESKGADFDTLEYKEIFVSEPISHCLTTIKRTIKKMYRDLDATHILFFLGGSDNFRLDLPLPVKYKSNRKSLRKPKHLMSCREYLNKYYDTYIMNGVEADDIVLGLTEHLVNNTKSWASAVNQDKDFHTSLTQNRYWHIVNCELIELEGGLGKLYLQGKNVKGEGLMWLLFQLNQGDTTDNFSPKMFFKKRYGEKSYMRDFKDCKTEKELLIKWIGKWRELLPETINFTTWQGDEVEHDWLSLAELYFQCPFMRTNPDDKTTFSDLLERYHLGYLIGRDGY